MLMQKFHKNVRWEGCTSFPKAPNDLQDSIKVDTSFSIHLKTFLTVSSKHEIYTICNLRIIAKPKTKLSP